MDSTLRKKLNMGSQQNSIIEPIKNPVSFFRPVRTIGANEKQWGDIFGAFDSSLSGSIQYTFDNTLMSSYQSFAGYGYLQDLAQDALIRLCVSTRTDEMLRKWIELRCPNDEINKAIEDELRKMNVKNLLSHALTTMGLMGGSYVFIDDGAGTDERLDPINLSEKSRTVNPKNEIKFKVIDPIFTAPQSFNATDPTAQDFFKPSVFLVMGKPVHRSRLIRFVENEVPDLLKPSYNFLGLPQAQLLSDYVTEFKRNRKEENRLLQKFSNSFFKTDLSDVLYDKGGQAPIDERVRFFTKYRDNAGVTVIDKETEDFAQINTPISGVTEIVRQSLEHVIAMNQTGVVKTLGVSPSGFSATGESDLRMQADLVATRQEKILRKPLETILRIVQLRLFGKIDPEVTFSFVPLIDEDERIKAEINKINADTDAVLISQGVITNDEARDRIRKDDNSGYDGLEGEAPEMPEIGRAHV